MNYELHCGNALDVLRRWDDGQVRCVVTSPPYFGLRDYKTGHWEGGDPNCQHRYANPQRGTAQNGEFSQERTFEGGARPMLKHCRWCGAVRIDDQIGLEPSVELYVQKLVEVFREVKRVLADDGTVWLNLGDSYVTRPRGNKKGQHSTSSLTNPERQEKAWAHNIEWRVQNGRPDFDPKAKHGLMREPGRPNRRNEMNGLKHKDLIGTPWMVAFALRADGWFLRTDIIWEKRNALPESVRDRPTRSHEYLFLLSKKDRYYYDYKAIQEPSVSYNHPRYVIDNTPETPPGTSPHSGLRTTGLAKVIPIRKNDSEEVSGTDHRKSGFQDRWDNSGPQKMRNKRDVWSLTSEPYKGSHMAVMPLRLVEPCVLAGSATGDIVMDPFCGSGTVGVVALRHSRKFIGIDLQPKYLPLAHERIQKELVRLEKERRKEAKQAGKESA